jgi:hypothetical protein
MIYLEATIKCMPVLKLKIVYLKALDIAGIDQYSLIKNTSLEGKGFSITKIDQ